MNVVAHNLEAMNSNRQLGIVSTGKAKSTEKLSSGYKINRSADDAAGLAISEKMRWQIRGLDKGSQNIGDGISLIQTAEGALNEVHSILQRVRELSVQALNDTNTESDRYMIQLEVDKSLEEIDHIRDTTMFNTKPLLQGNEYKDVKITPDTVTEYTYEVSMKRNVPDWIEWDKKLEIHNAYNYSPQDLNDIMKVTNKPIEKDENGNLLGVYYGKKKDTEDGTGTFVEEGVKFTYGGAWSENINDNPSAKISFKKLENATSVQELRRCLTDLIGVKFEFPCGTCNSVVNSLGFTGSSDGISCYGFEKYNNDYKEDHSSYVDLSSTKITYDLGTGRGMKTYNGYFELLDDMFEDYSENYDNDDTNNNDAEELSVGIISEIIARDLRNKSYDALKTSIDKSDHFDRIIKPSDDQYSLIVYDYRDRDKMTDYNSSLTIERSRANLTMPATSFQEGVIIPVEQKLNIMCGALNTSYIGLDLPDISLGNLGLNGYSIANYPVETTITYNMSDEQRQKYEQELAEWKSTAHTVTRTGTRKIKTLESYEPAQYEYLTLYNNGEKSIKSNLIKPASAVYKEETEDYTYTYTEYTGNRPTPPEASKTVVTKKYYAPSSLDLVDEAIDKVSRARAMLGSQQNRLEYSYNINNNTSENTSAAESRIRDTDMAKEMVNYSKHNILEQSGQSMLAQANQGQQGILNLLS